MRYAFNSNVIQILRRKIRKQKIKFCQSQLFLLISPDRQKLTSKHKMHCPNNLLLN